MSEIVDEINRETNKFKKIFDTYGRKGYYSCHRDVTSLIKDEIVELKQERDKADDFDSAILSVLIGYLGKINDKILDLEYKEV